MHSKRIVYAIKSLKFLHAHSSTSLVTISDGIIKELSSRDLTSEYIIKNYIVKLCKDEHSTVVWTLNNARELNQISPERMNRDIEWIISFSDKVILKLFADSSHWVWNWISSITLLEVYGSEQQVEMPSYSESYTAFNETSCEHRRINALSEQSNALTAYIHHVLCICKHIASEDQHFLRRCRKNVFRWECIKLRFLVQD